MKRWLPYPVLASIVTAVLFFLAKLPIGVSALIAFLGWPILGTLVTADDDLPGGWSNPDGTATPIWETFLFWGSLSGGAAIVCLAFALQVGFALQWLGCSHLLVLVSQRFQPTCCIGRAMTHAASVSLLQADYSFKRTAATGCGTIMPQSAAAA